MSNRRQFIAGLCAAGVFCTANNAMAQGLSLEKIDAYLNNIDLLKARFTQINGDGSSLRGTLYIRRPYRMRFEYDAPVDARVIAEAGKVAVFDGKSNTRPKIYPLRNTPLWLLLAPDISLAQSDKVLDRSSFQNTTTIDVADPKRPETGRMRFFFQNQPIALKQWVFISNAAQRTTTILNTIERPDNLPIRLFVIK